MLLVKYFLLEHHGNKYLGAFTIRTTGATPESLHIASEASPNHPQIPFFREFCLFDVKSLPPPLLPRVRVKEKVDKIADLWGNKYY